jgi:energy-coupling factor transporter ATP-binding protein EcfA2
VSILQEIFEWSKELPDWQSDAIARILAKHNLDDDDVKDFYAMLKSSHGIVDPDGRIPQPLMSEKIPALAKNNSHLQLLAIKNLRNVNAIAENQRLDFAPAGMTVIYGDNGSGKSGYSRVLKRACRARDQSEPIHSNAYLPAEKTGAAEAEFEIAINGELKTVQWVNGKIIPEELSTVALFDTRCARAYLDTEDDFSYIPYGLDVFDELAKLCKKLKLLTDAEHAQAAVDRSFYLHLCGETKVGKLLQGLSAKTNIDHIEELAKIDEADLSKFKEIEKSLKENNPREKANQNRLRAKRLHFLVQTVKSKSSSVSEATVTELQELSKKYRTAQAAAELAAKAFKEKENLLPGTGEQPWRELFEAAKAFAAISHPDQTFPHLGNDSPCPLCQQPLGEGAERLLRFEEFIHQETEKAVKESRHTLFAKYKPFVELNLNIGLDEVTYGELEIIDKQLAVDIRQFEVEMTARRDSVKNAVEKNLWEGIVAHPIDPSPRLEIIVAMLSDEATALEKAADEKGRQELQNAFNELNARIRLSEIKDAVKNVVSKLIYQTKLQRCLTSIRTNGISLKSAELAEKVVSKELESALNKEFKQLGVGTLRVALHSRVEKGKPLHKLKLELPQNRNPADILSEGEQRAIAIGSFLAEINLSGSNSGIVFDDPVCSLDHRRRERVALRLAQESAKRQVVVFTHDIYFLCLLIEQAKLAHVPVITQSLNKTPAGFGVADPELPFEGKNTSSRISYLRNEHQNIAKLYKEGNDAEYRRKTVDAYVRMRMTWERAVEEVLLRQVVLRFRKGVETNRLAEVSVEDGDYKEVYAGMTKCSNYPHDKALDGGIALPEPDELLQDIETLDNWRSAIEKRSKAMGAKRKANVPPAVVGKVLEV